ncbi:MAG: glycosyltransferase [Singulisphaera sp.]
MIVRLRSIHHAGVSVMVGRLHTVAFRVLTNFAGLPDRVAGCAVEVIQVRPSNGAIVRSILGLATCDAVIINGWPKGLMALGAARMLVPFGLLRRARLVSVDLALAPQDGRLVSRIKSRLLREVDGFLLPIKDTSGYEIGYGIGKEKISYFPFKVNSLDLIRRAAGRGQEYVLTCGQSYRDFGTFCAAMSGLDYPAIILTPRGPDRALHGSSAEEFPIPNNVRIVHDDGSPESWIGYIADAKLLVLCIAPEAINPSGLSAYLVAMALGKCVVITESPATRGILADGQDAVLVPVRDPGAVRAAIAELWVDDARRDAIARRGYEYAMSLGGDDEYHRNVINRVIELVRGDRPDEPAGPAASLTRSPAGAPSRTAAPDPGDLDRS